MARLAIADRCYLILKLNVSSRFALQPYFRSNPPLRLIIRHYALTASCLVSPDTVL
jgi:hypothetical protein